MVKLKQNNSQRNSNTRRSDERFAYRTVIISAVLGGITLFISFLFNTEILTIFMSENFIISLVDIIIKVSLILFSFLFFLISLGNYKELTGKPLSWKQLIILIILAFLQSIMNPIVFGYVFIGVLIIIIYIFLTQNS